MVHKGRGAVLVLAAVAYAVVAARFAPFTNGIRIATAVPCVVVGAVVLVRRRRGRTATEPLGSTAGVVGWSALVAAVVGVELVTLFSSPRDDHPTISSIAEVAFAAEGLRAGAFALWLAAGWYLATR